MSVCKTRRTPANDAIRILFCLATAALALVLVAGRCEAQARAAIQSVYSDADNAANRGDANGAAGRFGDPMLKDQALQSLSTLFRAVTSPSFTTRIIGFTQPSGNQLEAVVVIRQHFQAILNRHGVAALIASDAKFREFWTENGGQWQTMRTRVLGIRRTLNGREVKAW